MNHFRFMKSNTFVNFSIWLTLLDFQSQFLTSHAIFNYHAYANGWIESCLANFHLSPFVMLHLKTLFPCLGHWDPTPTTVALKLIWSKLVLGMVDIICNNYQLISFALGFGMNIISSLLIIPPLHNHGISQNANIHFSMVLMSRTFSKVESLPSLAFSTTKPCTSFKCLVNNHLAQYVTM